MILVHYGLNANRFSGRINLNIAYLDFLEGSLPVWPEKFTPWFISDRGSAVSQASDYLASDAGNYRSQTLFDN